MVDHPFRASLDGLMTRKFNPLVCSVCLSPRLRTHASEREERPRDRRGQVQQKMNSWAADARSMRAREPCFSTGEMGASGLSRQKQTYEMFSSANSCTGCERAKIDAFRCGEPVVASTTRSRGLIEGKRGRSRGDGSRSKDVRRPTSVPGNFFYLSSSYRPGILRS